MTTGDTPPAWARGLDTVLDRSVVLGYSKIGYAIRRHLPGWPVDPSPGALDGCHVAVTGASSGLGRALAAGLARLGADVHLVVRDADKGGRTVAELARETGSGRLDVWRCDVSDLESVAAFTKAFLGTGVPLHGLVHNAGAMPPEWTASAQGHELSMALHVLGPVRMTEDLLPLLSADGDARVVLVSSGGMYAQPLEADDLDFHDGDYRPTAAYARSKRAQVELLPMLSRRWAPAGVAVWGTHPGWAATPGVTESIPAFARLAGPILRAPDKGADTVTWLMATHPRPPSGGLWHDRRERPTSYLARTTAHAGDVEQLWDWVGREAGIMTEDPT